MISADRGMITMAARSNAKQKWRSRGSRSFRKRAEIARWRGAVSGSSLIDSKSSASRPTEQAPWAFDGISKEGIVALHEGRWSGTSCEIHAGSSMGVRTRKHTERRNKNPGAPWLSNRTACRSNKTISSYRFGILRADVRTACLIRILGGLLGLGAQHAFLHQLADLDQRLVLDLADTFLGHADDPADLFEGQRAILFLVPIEALTDHRLLDIAQLGQVAIDDLLELIDAIFLDHVALLVDPVALLQVGLELHREAQT